MHAEPDQANVFLVREHRQHQQFHQEPFAPMARSPTAAASPPPCVHQKRPLDAHVDELLSGCNKVAMVGLDGEKLISFRRPSNSSCFIAGQISAC